MPLSEGVRQRLAELADRYETASFSMNDPSRVLKCYSSEADVECAAFIMAILSFGRREQFLQKAEALLAMAGGHIAEWIADGALGFPAGERKFYRFYSYDDMRDVLSVLKSVLQEQGTFGQAVRLFMQRGEGGEQSNDAAAAISGMFKGCRAVSHTKTSANKRIRMFLRWMVRRDSPVDLGLWTWLSQRDLIIPLDTHVLQSAKKLSLVPDAAVANDKTARLLTEVLKEVWPDDPCKGDFALFGWGVEHP